MHRSTSAGILYWKITSFGNMEGNFIEKNDSSTQPVRAIKKMFSQTHPQIKFENGSVKQNILIVCTGWR